MVETMVEKWCQNWFHYGMESFAIVKWKIQSSVKGKIASATPYYTVD